MFKSSINEGWWTDEAKGPRSLIKVAVRTGRWRLTKKQEGEKPEQGYRSQNLIKSDQVWRHEAKSSLKVESLMAKKPEQGYRSRIPIKSEDEKPSQVWRWEAWRQGNLKKVIDLEEWSRLKLRSLTAKKSGHVNWPEVWSWLKLTISAVKKANQGNRPRRLTKSSRSLKPSGEEAWKRRHRMATKFRLTERWFNDDKVEFLCPSESLMKTEEETCKPRRPVKIAVQSKVKIQNEEFLWTWMTKIAGKQLWNPPDNANKLQRVKMMVNASFGEEEDFQGNDRIQRSVNEDRWKLWRQWNFANVAVRESSWALAKKLYQGCCPGRLMKTVKEMPYQSFDFKKMAKNDDMTDDRKS